MALSEGMKIPDSAYTLGKSKADIDNIYNSYSPEQRKMLFPWLPQEVEQTAQDIAKPNTDTIKADIEKQVDLFKKSLSEKQKADTEELGSRLTARGLTFAGAQESGGSELAKQYADLLTQGESQIRIGGNKQVADIEKSAFENAQQYLNSLKLMREQKRLQDAQKNSNVSVVYGGTIPSQSTTPEAMADQAQWFQNTGPYGGFKSEDELNRALAMNGKAPKSVYSL